MSKDIKTKMKFAVVVVFCVTLQQHIPSTLSVSYCSPAQYTGGPLYAPIDIDTSYATEVKTETPLTSIIGDYEKYLVKNTGDTVEVTVNQPTTINILTGGTLGKTVYVFYKIRYFWVHDYNGRVSYSVDDSEFPLTAELIFYKQSCGSYAKAYNESLSIVVIRVQYSVEGAIANPLFAGFENALRNVTKAGSSYCVNGQIRNTIFAFYDPIALSYPFYYSYTGTFYDQSQNNSTMCQAVTYLVIPKSRTGYVSICQFSAFTDLRNYLGEPIANPQTVYPSRGRTITQAAGIVEKVIPKPW